MQQPLRPSGVLECNLYQKGHMEPLSPHPPWLKSYCFADTSHPVPESGIHYSLREWPLWCGNWSSLHLIELWTGFLQGLPPSISRQLHSILMTSFELPIKPRTPLQSSYSSGDIYMRLGFPFKRNLLLPKVSSRTVLINKYYVFGTDCHIPASF